MPHDNQFRHQSYAAGLPTCPWSLLKPQLPCPAGSPEYDRLMSRVGQSLREAGVATVYLVHGTFAGDDALGLIRGLARIAPERANRLRRVYKEVFDKVAKDLGNYSTEFAAEFERSAGIPVRSFHWSSENQHIARAHAAIQLIDKLAAADLSPDQRILLWGHSHAGNVFALVTNLLQADQKTRRDFFRACRAYYRWPFLGRTDLPVWTHVRRLLKDRDAAGKLPRLDVVTFGTPIRYGWDTDGYAKLLHFIYHRPRPEVPAYQTVIPQSIEDVLAATDGDYVQQWGIAGTNLAPDVFAWRTWMADLRLGPFLQGALRRRDLLQRLKAGQRVPEEGETVLVDYGNDPLARQLAGHAVYTRLHWLPFHAVEVARRLYGLAVEDPQSDS